MVTRAAKDLLRNTIRHMDFHNRLREEEDMWKHWELGKGLTMMVTDDFLRKRMSSSDSRMSTKELSRHKREARKCSDVMGNIWSKRLMEAEENDPDRWGHSGYKELYPNEFRSPSPLSSQSESNSSSTNSSSTERKSQKRRKIKRHKRAKHRKSETRERRRANGEVSCEKIRRTERCYSSSEGEVMDCGRPSKRRCLSEDQESRRSRRDYTEEISPRTRTRDRKQSCRKKSKKRKR